MASIFKRSRDRNKKGAPWYINYFDANGKRLLVKGCPDKAATEAMARKLESEAALRRCGVIDAKQDERTAHQARPVEEHLADWHRDMLAKRKTQRHADQYIERAGKMVALVAGVKLEEFELGRSAQAVAQGQAVLSNALRNARLTHLRPERIQAALAHLKDAGKSLQTANHYRAALRAFVRWLGDKNRLQDNPMRGVSGYNVEEDHRHIRRSLTHEELARLVEAAKRGPVIYGMPGTLRALAYRLAAGTGFRVSELRSLTPENFRLEGGMPTISLGASATKNRRSAEQPIAKSLAEELIEWLADKPAGKPVLPLHHETAKAIRRDLEAAGIPYETDEGVFDFHALRAFYITTLVNSGADIKTVQTLARHAKPQTTLTHYAKVSPHDLRNAVESLPQAKAPSKSTGQTTTSEGVPSEITSPKLAAHWQQSGDGTGRELAGTVGAGTNGEGSEGKEETPETQSDDGFGRSLSAAGGSQAERGGFEPPIGFDTYNGLANRRFRPLSHLSVMVQEADRAGRDRPRVG